MGLQAQNRGVVCPPTNYHFPIEKENKDAYNRYWFNYSCNCLMPWMLMLALGNFGLSQFGLIDCFPAALFVAAAFGCTKDSSK